MTWRVTIPNWRPCPDNKLAGGIHWAVRAKRKRQDADMVAVYCWDRAPKATGKRRVRLEIVLSGRQKQVDPLAYCKSLFDALVKCGMLVDDSIEWVEFGGVTFTRGEKTSTTIILEELLGNSE